MALCHALLKRPIIYDGSVLGRARDPLKCFPSDTLDPLSGFATPKPKLGVVRFVWGGFLQARHYPSPLADQQAPMIRGSTSVRSLTVGLQGTGNISPIVAPEPFRGECLPLGADDGTSGVLCTFLSHTSIVSHTWRRTVASFHTRRFASMAFQRALCLSINDPSLEWLRRALTYLLC